MSRPWPHETVAVPQRIDGWRVVAAAKLPSGPGPDLYIAVVEAMGTDGFIFHGEVHWLPRHGFKAIEGKSTSLLDYRDAMFLYNTQLKSVIDGL